MKTSEALKIFDLKNGRGIDKQKIKEIWHELSKKHHPDKGGCVEIMALINDAKDTLILALEKEFLGRETAANYDILNDFLAACGAVRNLPNITIELCGSWIWVSGNTKPYKETLKNAGMFWARKKGKWYWRHPDSTGNKRKGKSWDMDKIRNRYGSETINIAKNFSLA